MTFSEYSHYFETIVNTASNEQEAPYDNADYIDYTRLNWSRMNRWLKNGQLLPELKSVMKALQKPQHWIVIAEPWCGDAGQCTPFIELAARENPLITVSYELRDTEPFLINKYLTNGSKSIPKLVIRDEHEHDLAIWGPRPKNCQVLYQKLLNENAGFDQIKKDLQYWYNANKGKDMQKELLEIFKSI